MSNLFVFEGPDGSGKTTVVAAVRKKLRASKVNVIREAFPGSARGSLGRLVYDLHHAPEQKGVDAMNPLSRQLLHVAAHVDSIEGQILPALRLGTVVLLDRFWWSTWVHGTLDGIPHAQLRAMLEIEHIAWDGVQPRAVFLFRRTQEAPPPKLAEAYEQLAERERLHYPVLAVDNSGKLADTVDTIVSFILRATNKDA